MIRRKAVSVKVKSPSKGLVTRWPSETADRFYSTPPDLATLQTGMALQRSWTVAQNVRFEDGVITAAPGYIRANLVFSGSTLLASLVAHWRLDEASGIRYDASVNDNDLVDTILVSNHPGVALSATPGKIANAAFFQATSDGQVKGYYDNLVSSDFTSTLTTGDWTICGWIKPSDISGGNVTRFLNFANFQLRQSAANLTWGLGGTVASVSSLVAGTWAFFVASYTHSSHQLSLSINNGSASTATLAVDATTGFHGQLYLGQLGFVANTFDFSVDSVSFFSRLLTGGEITQIYNSGTALDYPFVVGEPGTLLYEGDLVTAGGDAQTPLIFGVGSQLFSVAKSFTNTSGGNPIPATYTATLTQIYPSSGSGTATTAGYNWTACDFFDKVIFAQHDNRAQYSLDGTNTAADLPGLAINSGNIFGTDNGAAAFDGVETFFGHVILWRGQTLVWSDVDDFSNYIPVGGTSVSATLSANGFTQPPADGSTVVALTFTNGLVPLVADQFIRMIDTSTNPPTYNYYQVQASPAPTANSCSVLLLSTTGAAAAAHVFGSQTFTTLDANEAGTLEVVGANVNGPIWQVVGLSDFCYLFKEWSVLSIAYIGQPSGVFQLRTEVTREGLLGRNSVVKLVNGGIFFLGHRELYNYNSGSAPQPVARQYTRQLLSEVDRTKLDEIILIHRDIRNEIWVVYPVQGGQKVLIYNYTEDSCSLDFYSPDLMGIVAGSRASWVDDPGWSTFSDSQTWDSFADTQSWSSFTGTGKEELALLATGNFELLIHGNAYTRDNEPYTALGETLDFNFDDDTSYKYIDVAHVGLQVNVPSNSKKVLYVQVGYRPTLDAAISWTPRQAIQVQGGNITGQGNANFTAKVNPGGAGRYLRLRFYSGPDPSGLTDIATDGSDTGVSWRVSSFEIYGRLGGTY